jgi:hypothetical protein
MSVYPVEICSIRRSTVYAEEDKRVLIHCDRAS